MVKKAITVSLAQYYLAQAMNLSMDECQDTNVGEYGEELVDSGSDGCDWYIENYMSCGQHNTDMFDSIDMCCACGGGDVPNGAEGDEGDDEPDLDDIQIDTEQLDQYELYIKVGLDHVTGDALSIQ